MRRSPLTQPEPVLQIRRILNVKSPAVLFGAHPPLVRFGMAVRERKPTTEIMVCPWHVVPDRAFHPGAKRRIIEIFDVFIQQYPKHGWPRRLDRGHLPISAPRRVPPVRV